MSLSLSLLAPLFGGIVGAIQDGLQSRKETKQQEKDREYELKKHKLTLESNLELAKIQGDKNLAITQKQTELQQEKTKEKQEDFEIERVKSIRDTNTYDLQESSSKWINITNFIRSTTRPFLTYAFFILCFVITMKSSGYLQEQLAIAIVNIMGSITGYWFYTRTTDKRTSFFLPKKS